MSESKCTCPNVLAGALSSTVIIFLAISIVTFIIGLMLRKHFTITKAKAYTCTRINHPQVGPEYEDIDMQPVANTVKRQEQGLELKKNVAYGASKSMAIEKQ